MDIPDQEPASIRSGDLIEWTKDLSAEYPADDGWGLTYTLKLQSNAATGVSVNATASGKTFAIALTVAQTVLLPAGTYILFGRVTKALNSKEIYTGTCHVLPNLAAVLTGDLRSTVKRKIGRAHV